MVESRRSACSALALRLCGVEPATRPRRPQQHREPYCLRLGLSLYYLGRPIKGNWDTKTTRCTTTWLVARPETGLITASRRGRVLGVQQDTLGLALALRLQRDAARA